jgi:hypothetical protein
LRSSLRVSFPQKYDLVVKFALAALEFVGEFLASNQAFPIVVYFQFRDFWLPFESKNEVMKTVFKPNEIFVSLILDALFAHNFHRAESSILYPDHNTC